MPQLAAMRAPVGLVVALHDESTPASVRAASWKCHTEKLEQMAAKAWQELR